MTLISGLQFDRYHADTSEEWIVLIGSRKGAPVLLVPPLFEEMNRTRALMVAVMRALAEEGFGCWLPDLPGTGESERALEECTWHDWRTATEAATSHVAREAGIPPLVASLRGGCLLDDATPGRGHWRFAPAEGASLARDLERSSLVAAKEQSGPYVDFSGYPVSMDLLEALRTAHITSPSRLRTLRLASDRAEADHKVVGPALWRRSEPGRSDVLAAALAADLASWYAACAG